MGKIQQICWLTEIASPYKMKLLSLISESVKLTILLKDDKSLARNDNWYSREHGNAELVIIKDNYLSQIREIAKKCDMLIDSVYSKPVGIYAVACFRLYHKKVVIHAALQALFRICAVLLQIIQCHGPFLLSAVIIYSGRPLRCSKRS